MRVAVVTDSTAYLPEDLRQRYNIRVVPLRLHWGDQTYRDGIDITPETFYQRLRQAQEIPTTSQPPMQDFLDTYRALAEEGYDAIVAVLISSGISGTVASARAAAQECRLPVQVVDTRSTSVAQGWIALEAARAAEQGASLEEVVARAEAVRERMAIWFVVDTLKYLHKGGRIGGASRLLGTMLNIKPLLYFTPHGTIDALERVRTKRRALLRMVDLAIQHAGDRPVNVGITHADAEDTLRALEHELQRCLDVREWLRAPLSPVLGAHVGPGTIGLAVYPVLEA
ncbi:MAG: DegV family protein [Chloroflexi bacterium]|nr:DegV family protein [Chloroflexota bacterium]